jgi:hypothetical protein
MKVHSLICVRISPLYVITLPIDEIKNRASFIARSICSQRLHHYYVIMCSYYQDGKSGNDTKNWQSEFLQLMWQVA